MTSEFMRLALREAEAALGSTSPNPSVGAVVVNAGRVVGRGHTQPPGGPHAEVMALREAGEEARGATVYATLEPCNHTGRTPPCTEALIAAGVAEVVYALDDPDERVDGEGARRLRAAGIKVTGGDGAEEAAWLLQGYLKHRRTGIPAVIVKYAASLDGRIASASGDARWVSGPEARAWVHRLRRRVDAILVGSGTVLADDPELTARPASGEVARQPLRVVVDSRGRTPASARVLGQGALVATLESASAGWRAEVEATGAEVLALPAKDRYVSFEALLRNLGERGIVNLLVEGGGTLLGSLFDQRRVDRLYAVIAPIVIGAADAPSAVAGRGAQVMAQAARLSHLSVEQLGEDILVAGIPAWTDPSTGASDDTDAGPGRVGPGPGG